MKHLKKSPILVMLLTLTIGSAISAQDLPSFSFSLPRPSKLEMDLKISSQIIQDNEYTTTGYEQGNFYLDPLLLNGKPIDYYVFNIESKGELTVIKGAPITAKVTQVLFRVYLRRNGFKVFIPDHEKLNLDHSKLDLSKILRYASPGDLLVIEPVKKEDGPAKRILKLLKASGC